MADQHEEPLHSGEEFDDVLQALDREQQLRRQRRRRTHEHQAYLLGHPWLQFAAGTMARSHLPRYTAMIHGRSCAIDWDFLQVLGDRAYAEQIVGVRRLFDWAYMPSYRELTVEFLCSFTFSLGPPAKVISPGMISFRLGNQAHQMSVASFGVLAGLYTETETQQEAFLTTVMQIDAVTLEAWWPTISDGPFRYRDEAKGRVTAIRDPLHRYLHRCIASSITARTLVHEWVTLGDLFYLHCLLAGVNVNLAGGLALYFLGDLLIMRVGNTDAYRWSLGDGVEWVRTAADEDQGEAQHGRHLHHRRHRVHHPSLIVLYIVALDSQISCRTPYVICYRFSRTGTGDPVVTTHG